jgi:arylsulfatase A
MDTCMRFIDLIPARFALLPLAVSLAWAILPRTTVSAAPPTAQCPNVIFVLADDFGYGSSNAYGADRRLLRTPHLDRLANEGMRFTDASAPASVCSPSRYGFLTGRYPFRSRQKYGVLYWWDNLLLNPAEDSLAGLMKRHGYATAHIGKWHLGYGDTYPVDYTARLSPGPNQVGFDYHLGVPHQHGDIMGVYIENDRVRGLRSRQLSRYSRSFYQATPFMGIDAPQRVDKDAMRELTDFATEWIRQKRDERFFLYFAPVAVHHPITPSDAMRGTSHCGAYGDFIHDLDWSVGRLLETLDYLNLTGKTLVIFTSDNGGEIPENNNEEFPEIQAVKAGLAINGRLRGDKHTIWEGGTRVPFIARWPGRIPCGATCDAMISLVDMYATLWDLLAGSTPKPAALAPDSFSFLPCLTDPAAKPTRRTMVTQDANGMLAIRSGEWKYVDDTPPIPLDQYPEKDLAFRKRAAATKPALFNLQADLEEKTDLYASRPELVQRLKTELDTIRKDPTAQAP